MIFPIDADVRDDSAHPPDQQPNEHGACHSANGDDRQAFPLVAKFGKGEVQSDQNNRLLHGLPSEETDDCYKEETPNGFDFHVI